MLVKLTGKALVVNPVPSLRRFTMITIQIGIYKITNLVTNKVYIGQTTNYHQRRIDHFKSSAINRRPIELHQDMHRLGADKFKMELLEKCGTNQLDDREKFWTDKYKKDHDLYNLVSGNPVYSEHNSIIQSKFMHDWNNEQWKNPEYRAERSKQSSEVQKKRLENPKYRQEKSRQLKQYTDSIKKKIAQYDKSGNLIKVYDGVRIAERETGIGSQEISAVANHKKYRKSAGGYHWEFV